jgi:DNA-binding Xre family transcriptional regulator
LYYYTKNIKISLAGNTITGDDMKSYVKLKKLRTQKDLTQLQLQDISGVNRNVISYIEVNPSANIRIHTLIKLAVALECDLNDLLEYRV